MTPELSENSLNHFARATGQVGVSGRWPVPDSGIMPALHSIEPGVEVQAMLSSALLNHGLVALTVSDTKRMSETMAMLTRQGALALAEQLIALAKVDHL